MRPKTRLRMYRAHQHFPKYDDFGRQRGIEHLGTALGGHQMR